MNRRMAKLLFLLLAGLAASLEAAPATTKDGYLQLGFDRLAGFRFVAPPYDPVADPGGILPTGEEQIPAEVKSWNGKQAIVAGFMLPVKMEGGLVTELLLMRDQMMCCYGIIPNMNDWVVVRLKKGVRPLLDVPVSFYGDFQVGAMFEHGYLVGIYQLDADKMVPL